MFSTLVRSQDGKMIVSKTLVETAIALRSQKREFHASEIVALLKDQGVEISESKVRSQLAYSGAGYTGKPRKRQYWQLDKLEGGMYRWNKYEFDPSADLKNMIREIE